MRNNKNILIIDDSSSSLLLLEWFVVNEGYKAFLAESVSIAIDSIKKKKPDLILLDLNMPLISGHDFLKMRDELQIRDVPIVVISAVDTEENIEQTIKEGAREFISKPITQFKILEIIKRYLPE